MYNMNDWNRKTIFNIVCSSKTPSFLKKAFGRQTYTIFFTTIKNNQFCAKTRAYNL